MILPASFYQRDTVKVARGLLGKKLVRIYKGKRLSGLIVETEAYTGVEDAAAHSYGGVPTPRTRTMYMGGGHAYVYFIYGMYWCLNFVTKKVNEPEAVLIRALEPVENIEIMRKLRPVKKDKDLTNGPGKLCLALHIDKSLDGANLTEPPLFVENMDFQIKPSQIVIAPRVGVDYAGPAAHWPLRFYIRDNPYVSRLVKNS